jgi:hypothetical protein
MANHKIFTPRNAVILIGATFLFWGAARMLYSVRLTQRLYRTART